MAQPLLLKSGPRIIVLGSGLAGLAASLSALDTHPSISVLLLESLPKVGGATQYATSGISIAASPSDVAIYERDLLASAGRRGSPALARVLAAGGPSTAAFLAAHGAPALPLVVLTGGHSVARTRLPFPPTARTVGARLVDALQAALHASPRAEVRTGARVVALRRAPQGGGGGGGGGGAVVGVDLADGSSLDARAVVVATGGFGASAELLAAHAPGLQRLPFTAAASATGEGHGLCARAGALLVDMDAVQLHPTAFLGEGDGGADAGADAGEDAGAGAPAPRRVHLMLAPEALRGGGALLLDGRGARFCNELARRDELSAAVGALPGARAALVLTEAAGKGLAGVPFYVARGLLRRVEGAAGLAAFLNARLPAGGATAAGVAEALRAAGAGAGAEHADAFGKPPLQPACAFVGAATGPLLVGMVTPAVHYTLGGVAIDPRAHVLAAEGAGGGGVAVVPGLFAAGEVTGGVHGGSAWYGEASMSRGGGTLHPHSMRAHTPPPHAPHIHALTSRRRPPCGCIAGGCRRVRGDCGEKRGPFCGRGGGGGGGGKTPRG
jgi:succinate dehydrogenase/fumarate reductase flavoprotein subunit